MVSNLGASTPFGEPGAWDDASIETGFGAGEGDIHFDSDEDSYSGPETVTSFVTPSFEYGEVWALKIRCTLSSEPTDGIIVLELMDEDEDDYIQKATFTEYGGNDAEINTIVDWEVAGYDDGSGSPDVRLTVVGEDGGNFFIDCVGVRLRRPVRDDDLTVPRQSTESFD